MKKRILSIVLTLCMLVGLVPIMSVPTSAAAYPIRVSGTWVSDSNAADILGNGTARYVESENTLYLTDYNGGQIIMGQNLTIKLSGNNTITGSGFGIGSGDGTTNYNLTIAGDSMATLAINTGAADHAIVAGSTLNISKVKVTTTGNVLANNITVTDGQLDVTTSLEFALPIYNLTVTGNSCVKAYTTYTGTNNSSAIFPGEYHTLTNINTALPKYAGSSPSSYKSSDLNLLDLMNNDYVQIGNPLYVVTFKDWDGTVLKTQSVAYGGSATAPADPSRTGFEFTGWDKSFTNIKADMVVTAQYSPIQCTVIFKDWDGTILKTETVSYGGSATAPANPSRDGYEFTGWDKTFNYVTEDITVTAQYSRNTFTITWLNDDGTLIDTTAVAPGEVPTHADPTKTATAEYTYTFAGWDPEIVAATGDATYTATYTPVKRSYTITWKNDDGSLIDTTTVEYGVVPTHADPTKESTDEFNYTFAGWTPEIEAVTGDATYTAAYTSETRTYTVTWVNYDGSVLETDENVRYGEMPSYSGKEPEREADAQYTYIFSGWSPEVAVVTDDVTYTAAYTETPNKYTVIWQNDNGTVLETDENIEYGTMPTYDGEEPAKAADAQYTYTFAGWDPEVVAVEGNVTYTATYTETVNTYTVIWLDEDGTELKKDENVAYGTIPSYGDTVPEKTADAQYTYTFDKWTPEVVAVTGNATYTASYTAISKFASLTICKNVTGTTDADQRFIFTVAGGDLPNNGMQVIVKGGESVTINGLAAGQTYTVIEDTSWSWRYKLTSVGSTGTTTTNSATVTLAAADNATVTFTNERKNNKWLTDCAEAVNNWSDFASGVAAVLDRLVD